MLILRIVIIFIGALFIILGIALKDNDGKNGVFYVLQKAINICTECIGLG
ncbi:MAG: thioredoxin [Clostridia bacterium]|nr:thioredoxin [Clostridia bacterium]